MTRAEAHYSTAELPTELFKALGDLTRLRILSLLLHAPMRVCVCEMVHALQLPQYQISRQLAVLKRVKLVDAEKSGTWVYHGLDAEHYALNRLAPALRELLQGEPFDRDRARLDRRLSMRDGDRCVVGFVDNISIPENAQQ